MKWLKSTLLNPSFWMGSVSFDKTDTGLTVSIVVPAWNEESCIAATIESILAQDYPLKLIVVDDSSTDSTPDIVKKYPNVTLLTTDTNQGSKSQALNYAIPYVSTDLFICVDADTVLEPNSVRNLVYAFNDPDTMVACGHVYSNGDDNFWKAARYGEYLFGQSLVKSAQQNANIVLVASGCFFAIRTEYVKFRKFDTRTMAEDMDLTWCAIEDGYRVTFVNDAKCTVNDPDSKYLYEKQVSRWYRGFFQNILARRFNLFTKNPKLGIVAYSYMLMNLIGLPLVIYFMISTLSPISALYGLIIGFLMIVAITMFDRRKEGIRWYKYIWYGVCYFIISFYVYWLFVKSGFYEIILGKKLDEWVKGH